MRLTTIRDKVIQSWNRKGAEMTILEFLILLLIAGICGGIAQSLVGVSRGGCLTSIALGFIGALLGTWLSRAFGLPELFSIQMDGHSFPIVWSIIGAALFCAVIALLSGRRDRV
jgi:uncharacterized membrane protein YeaQ/YmgE (transglycosylase-associated protein family)